MTARLLAQGISGPLGQPVLVENRPSVITAATTVGGAQPDGHTLLMTGPNLWLLPLLESKTPFDPLRDFIPVTMCYGPGHLPDFYVATPVFRDGRMVGFSGACSHVADIGGSAAPDAREQGDSIYAIMDLCELLSSIRMYSLLRCLVPVDQVVRSSAAA